MILGRNDLYKIIWIIIPSEPVLSAFFAASYFKSFLREKDDNMNYHCSDRSLNHKHIIDHGLGKKQSWLEVKFL